MITPVRAVTVAAQGLPPKWNPVATSFPEPGKWVLIRTANYQRIARFENSVWRSVDGREEINPVVSWQQL